MGATQKVFVGREGGGRESVSCVCVRAFSMHTPLYWKLQCQLAHEKHIKTQTNTKISSSQCVNLYHTMLRVLAGMRACACVRVRACVVVVVVLLLLLLLFLALVVVVVIVVVIVAVLLLLLLDACAHAHVARSPNSLPGLTRPTASHCCSVEGSLMSTEVRYHSVYYFTHEVSS